jgi:predicted nucleic acid-binding protein
VIFVDTSAWVALFVKGDARHDEAVRLWTELRRRSIPLISTYDIFGETLTVIRSRASLEQALTFGEAFLASAVLVREEIGGDLRRQAWELFKQYRDKPLSFTDCTSFALLRKRGLRLVFSFDDDFRRLGCLVNCLP